MNEIPEGVDSEYFESVFAALDEYPEWEYDATTPRGRAADYAMDGFEKSSRREFVYNHDETDGTLLLGIPDVGFDNYAVLGELTQGITRAEVREDNELVFRLSDAQQGIAERHVEDSEYLSSARDQSVIASIRVPFDYDERDLLDSLDTLSNTSQEVEEMHSDLFETLSAYEG